jgi:hypothetical protein
MSTITYKPSPVAEQFMQSNAFVKAIMGPFGSGKSVTCVMELLHRASQQAPAEDGIRYTRFVIIRNTNRMLEDTTVQTVHEWVPPNTPQRKGAGEWLSTKKNFTLRFGDVHSEWWFRALDNPDDARNLLSMEVTGAWLNEYREINPRIFIDLLGRVGRYRGPGKVPPTWRGVIMDSNPPSADGFWHDFFEKPLADDLRPIAEKIRQDTGQTMRELFRQPSGMSEAAENKENLPSNYYEMLLVNNSHRGEEWINVHVHGEYGYLQDGDPVYKGFSHATHVAKEPLRPNPHQPLALGVDFGLTPAAVVGQQNSRGQWLILGELFFPGESMGIERFSERLLPWLRSRWPDNADYELYADPAGQQRSQSDEKTCFQVLRAAGFRVRPGPQDLATRIGSVQRVISRMVDGQPGVLYDPSCKYLIQGKMGAYRYRRMKTSDERLSESPEKNEASHPADAEQYLIAAYEGPAMQGRSARKWGKGREFNKPIRVKQNWRVWG